MIEITRGQDMLKAEADAALAVADWADLMLTSPVPDKESYSRARFEEAVEAYRTARDARQTYFSEASR